MNETGIPDREDTILRQPWHLHPWLTTKTLASTPRVTAMTPASTARITATTPASTPGIAATTSASTPTANTNNYPVKPLGHDDAEKTAGASGEMRKRTQQVP